MCEKEKSLFEQERQDFLWYALFGISKRDALNKKSDEVPQEPDEACIKRAYRDLNRTLKFTYSNKKLDEMRKEAKKNNDTSKEDLCDQYINCKDSWRDGCEKLLHDEIELLHDEIELLQEQNKQSDERQSCFDEWHKDLCEKLVKKSKKAKPKAYEEPLFEKKFTFGHAQKWVNMTLKYMLIMNVPDWEMDKLVSYLHVPIDSYILEGAYKKFPEELGKFIERKGNKNFEWRVRGKDQDDNAGSWVWSQIPTYDCYKGFQDAIREVLPQEEKPPIVWENSVWIEIAKERQK